MTDPASKAPPAAPQEQWLSAAECASRTGLTVRALRVYERQGLIKPPRSPPADEDTYHSEWDFMEKALQDREPRSLL